MINILRWNPEFYLSALKIESRDYAYFHLLPRYSESRPDSYRVTVAQSRILGLYSLVRVTISINR